MKIITKKPWWWFLTKVPWGKAAVTLGDSIYFPTLLPPWIIAHERVHIRQCKGSVLRHLWLMYKSSDMKFYEDLERPAHQAQYKEMLKWTSEKKAFDSVMRSVKANPYGLNIKIKRCV